MFPDQESHAALEVHGVWMSGRKIWDCLQGSDAWKPSGSSHMTRRASWLDLDHAESAEGPGQTALLEDEERGRLSRGTSRFIIVADHGW